MLKEIKTAIKKKDKLKQQLFKTKQQHLLKEKMKENRKQPTRKCFQIKTCESTRIKKINQLYFINIIYV